MFSNGITQQFLENQYLNLGTGFHTLVPKA